MDSKIYNIIEYINFKSIIKKFKLSKLNFYYFIDLFKFKPL